MLNTLKKLNDIQSDIDRIDGILWNLRYNLHWKLTKVKTALFRYWYGAMDLNIEISPDEIEALSVYLYSKKRKLEKELNEILKGGADVGNHS